MGAAFCLSRVNFFVRKLQIAANYLIIQNLRRIMNNSQIWPALAANFLALRVWEDIGAIQDDKYRRNDNNMEGMTIIWKE
jgi:hypothetical protein